MLHGTLLKSVLATNCKYIQSPLCIICLNLSQIHPNVNSEGQIRDGNRGSEQPKDQPAPVPSNTNEDIKDAIVDGDILAEVKMAQTSRKPI